jgi:hypothetical protein
MFRVARGRPVQPLMPCAPVSTNGTFFAVRASRARSRSMRTFAMVDHILRYWVLR